MKLKEVCRCGASFEIEVDMSNRPGTPTWDAILANLEKWRESHEHQDH